MHQGGVPEGTVTVLFTDLVDSTRLNQSLGDDAARDLSRRIEDAATRQVEAHRGVLIKEMGDGLMAAFASARRAVAASREIQSDMRRLRREGAADDVQMRIGLHTGEVIAEDGDLHGETVIIAKRIEGLAPPGGILVSDTVHGVLGTARDELVDQGPAELKGIADEWTLYLVPPLEDDEQQGLPDGAPTPYVGRAGERERLRTLLEQAAAGKGGMALVGGPAGMGKSRLTREATEVAAQLDMTVRTGNCLDMDSPPPYQPSIDQFEQTMRRLSTEEFRALLGENAPEIAKLMPSLLQRYDDIPAPPDLTPEQERRYMLHGVGEFLERAAHIKPLLLVFEDLHWADESTLLLLRHIADRIADLPLAVIGTYRDDELADRPLANALSPLVRDGGALDLRLQALDRDQTAALLAARAGQDPPDDLVGLVWAETHGNPYFAEELYRHLRDEGRLFDDDGAWRDDIAVGATEVPQSIRLLLGRRLDQLDDEHRRILAAAAVIGGAFAFGHLAESSGRDEDDLFDALEAAERLHLVEEAPAERDARYRFVHEQVRQTLLGELSLARRQRVHVRVADAIEATGGDGAAVEVAHHLVEAGPAAPADRTVAALLAAAEASAEVLAFEDALHHLANAEPLVEEEGRPELRSAQARALRGAGRVDDALALLDDALAAGPDPDEEVSLRLQRVQLLNDQYRAAEGLDDLDVLDAVAEDRQDTDLQVDVHLARGRAHYILSLDDPAHAERSRDAYQAAYDAAAALGDSRRMALALLPTTWFTDYWSDYIETARANVDEALDLAEELGDEDLVLDALMASMHRIGLKARTGVDADELLERLEARRDPVKLNAHCFWLMWRYLAQARFAESVAMCDRGIALADLIGSEPVQYGGIKAIALTEMGRFDDVAAAIDQEVTDDDHPFGQAMASLARSVFLTRLTAWPEAADSLDDTIERAVALSRTWMQAWAAGLRTVAHAHLEGDRPDEIDEMARRRSIFGPNLRYLTDAEAALVEGRPADAAAAATPVAPAQGASPTRDGLAALDVLARARLALGDAEGALEAADRATGPADECGYGAIAWRLHAVRGEALTALGRDDDAAQAASAAADRFRALADRIREPALRAAFEAQAFAPTAADRP